MITEIMLVVFVHIFLPRSNVRFYYRVTMSFQSEAEEEVCQQRLFLLFPATQPSSYP